MMDRLEVACEIEEPVKNTGREQKQQAETVAEEAEFLEET